VVVVESLRGGPDGMFVPCPVSEVDAEEAAGASGEVLVRSTVGTVLAADASLAPTTVNGGDAMKVAGPLDELRCPEVR